MNKMTKRRFSAWVLLSVFIPMLIVLSFHIHEGQASSACTCVDCVNHLPHTGHLSLNTDYSHDCVLCQFTTLPFVVAVAVTISIAVVYISFVVSSRPIFIQNASGRQLIPRAPPTV